MNVEWCIVLVVFDAELDHFPDWNELCDDWLETGVRESYFSHVGRHVRRWSFHFVDKALEIPVQCHVAAQGNEASKARFIWGSSWLFWPSNESYRMRHAGVVFIARL